MKVRFTTGETVDVVDADCEFRPCYVFGFDKGPFTPGVGYTRPETPWRPVCLTRDISGCPHKDPDEEHDLCCDGCGRRIERRSGPVIDQSEPCDHPYGRELCGSTKTYRLGVLLDPKPCCDTPDIPTPRKSSHPSSQRCRNCGARLKGKRLEIARASAPA